MNNPTLQQLDDEIDRMEMRAAELRGLIDNPPPVVYRNLDGSEIEVPVLAGDAARGMDNPIVQRLKRGRPGATGAAVGGQLQQNKAAQTVAKYPRRVMLAGVTLMLLAFVLPLLQGVRAAATSTPAPPTPTMAVPATDTPLPTVTPDAPASPTPAHAGLPAPSTLSGVKVGPAVTLKSIAIIPAHPDGSGTLVIPPPPDGKLAHWGSYPGEDGNVVLLGLWKGFGDQLVNLQLNDKLSITNKEGGIYQYQVIPCHGTQKECITAKDEVWPLGYTPEPTLTLVAAQSATTNYIVQAVFVCISDAQGKCKQ